MHNIQLFDMNKDDGYRKLERGAFWRSTELYRCVICGTYTNRWVMGGYLNTGPRITCPGTQYKEHHFLAKLHKKYDEVYTEVCDAEMYLDNSSIYICVLREQLKMVSLKKSLLEDRFKAQKLDDYDPLLNYTDVKPLGSIDSRYEGTLDLP